MHWPLICIVDCSQVFSSFHWRILQSKSWLEESDNEWKNFYAWEQIHVGLQWQVERCPLLQSCSSTWCYFAVSIFFKITIKRALPTPFRIEEIKTCWTNQKSIAYSIFHHDCDVNDLGICVRIGVATQSTYEHCSGDTELKCQNMHGNIVCLCCHSRCLSSVALK